MALKENGVKPGDSVAGVMPNLPETVVAMLASASLGATWTSCSPDFGAPAIMDRLGQTKPKVLFGVDAELWGHPLAVSGQLAQSNPDASHHFIPMAVI